MRAASEEKGVTCPRGANGGSHLRHDGAEAQAVMPAEVAQRRHLLCLSADHRAVRSEVHEQPAGARLLSPPPGWQFGSACEVLSGAVTKLREVEERALEEKSRCRHEERRHTCSTVRLWRSRRERRGNACVLVLLPLPAASQLEVVRHRAIYGDGLGRAPEGKRGGRRVVVCHSHPRLVG